MYFQTKIENLRNNEIVSNIGPIKDMFSINWYDPKTTYVGGSPKKINEGLCYPKFGMCKLYPDEKHTALKLKSKSSSDLKNIFESNQFKIRKIKLWLPKTEK